MEKKELADKIVKYRAKHNLTQAQLAERCKVTITTICLTENGKSSPSRLTLQKILNIIGGTK